MCPECENERWTPEERGFGQASMFLSRKRRKELLSPMGEHQTGRIWPKTDRKASNDASERPSAWLCGWLRLEPLVFPSRGTHYWALTHPDFPELPGAELLHQLNGLPRDLPGIFIPRLLWFGTNACLLQSSA